MVPPKDTLSEMFRPYPAGVLPTNTVVLHDSRVTTGVPNEESFTRKKDTRSSEQSVGFVLGSKFDPAQRKPIPHTLSNIHSSSDLETRDSAEQVHHEH